MNVLNHLRRTNSCPPVLTALVVGAMLLSPTLHAETTLRIVGSDDENQLIKIGPDKIVMRNLDNPNQRSIFDPSKPEMVHIDEANQSYVRFGEMTRAGVADEVNARKQQLMAEMQARLSSLPPAQRAIIEQQLGQNFAEQFPDTETDSVTKVIPTSQTEVIRGKETTLHEMFVDEVKSRLFYVIPATELGIPAADVALLAKMGDLMRKAQNALTGENETLFEEMLSQGLIPWRTVSLENGVPDHTWDIVEILQESYESTESTVPSSYTEKTLPLFPAAP